MPSAGPATAGPQRAAVGTGEEQRAGFRRDEPLKVDGQLLGDRTGEWHLAPSRSGLRPAGEEFAPDLDHLLGHVEPRAQHVDPAPAKPGQLADAEPSVAA